jgi:CubicO group peptidase (beta-lactamase class C family)
MQGLNRCSSLRSRPYAAWTIGAAWLVLTALGGFGSASDVSQAQGLLDAYAARADRAAAAAVVRGNTLLWSGATGTANKELEVRADDNTVFLIASISKTVTATAVMQLVEDGMLDLDEDINTYLPFAFNNPKQSDAVITLRHLLAHTSGLSDIYLGSVASDLTTKSGDPELSLTDFCRAFFTPEGAFYYPATFTSTPPGTAFNYSNLGFTLVGCIVEAVVGRPFDTFTERHIFAPLGMTRTSWRVADFQVEDMAMPYGHYGEVYGNYTFPFYPAGGLRTTVKDLSKFLRAFMLGGTLDGQTILQPAGVQELRRVQYPNVEDAQWRGLGWTELEFTDETKTKTFLGHSGNVPGGSTLMAYNPATKIGAIIFTNGEFSSEDDWNALVELFLALVKGDERASE